MTAGPVSSMGGGERSQRPLLSVLIVNWNNWPKLNDCLRSIERSTLAADQVIVIDNASSDGAAERIEAAFPRVELHRKAVNIGHTRAVNEGFGLARGRYLAILDNDTELDADCLRLLIEFMEAHPEAAMTAPRTFNSDGTIQESARNFPGAVNGLFGRQSLLTRLFPGNRFSRRYLGRNRLEADQPFAVEQIGGAFMLVRREALEALGPWDERYFGYWVDTDWCRAAQAQGLKIFCVPQARAIHHENNARHRRRSARRIWLFHHGAYQYYTKWHCRGAWDPRAILAGALLSGRALMLMGMSRLRRAEAPAASAPRAAEIESIATERGAAK